MTLIIISIIAVAAIGFSSHIIVTDYKEHRPGNWKFRQNEFGDEELAVTYDYPREYAGIIIAIALAICLVVAKIGWGI